MIEAYSLNTSVAAGAAVPFNNVSFKKGCTTTLEGTSSIALNKCGVYNVTFNASSATSAEMQMYKNGVAQINAQSTGTNPTIDTLVYVTENNTGCPCTAPTIIQFINEADAVATLINANVKVTKVR